MGRSTDNDIVIDCPSVSSHHCEMKRIEGGYILEDKDSTNGIKLDDERMEIIDLENDLDILVGDAALEFELTDKEKDALAEEDHVPKQRAPLPKKRRLANLVNVPRRLPLLPFAPVFRRHLPALKHPAARILRLRSGSFFSS